MNAERVAALVAEAEAAEERALAPPRDLADAAWPPWGDEPRPLAARRVSRTFAARWTACREAAAKWRAAAALAPAADARRFTERAEAAEALASENLLQSIQIALEDRSGEAGKAVLARLGLPQELELLGSLFRLLTRPPASPGRGAERRTRLEGEKWAVSSSTAVAPDAPRLLHLLVERPAEIVRWVRASAPRAAAERDRPPEREVPTAELPERAAPEASPEDATALALLLVDRLSDRERQLALLLMEGRTIAAAAREMGIKPATARAMLRRIRGKLAASL